MAPKAGLVSSCLDMVSVVGWKRRIVVCSVWDAAADGTDDVGVAGNVWFRSNGEPRLTAKKSEESWIKNGRAEASSDKVCAAMTLAP